MLEASVTRLLFTLRDSDLVLDVGGWACPFNRADYVLDNQPYETRGYYATFGGRPYQGPERARFTRETWVRADICAREPWPFVDRQFDFAVCSHTLEDVRDPVGVCAELQRVARAGYVEVPSRAWESTMGLERPGMAGLSHHRWLIELEGRRLRFVAKPHMMHADRRFHLPFSHRLWLTPESSVTTLWWGEDGFTAEEATPHGIGPTEAELEAFVVRTLGRSRWIHDAYGVLRRARALPGRVVGRLLRAVR